MKNSNATFLRNLQIVLRPLVHCTDSYVDDCATMSDSWRDHLSHLDLFLSTMLTEGVTKSKQINICTELGSFLWRDHWIRAPSP